MLKTLPTFAQYLDKGHFRGRCKSGHTESETGGHAQSEMTGHLAEMGDHAGLKYAVIMQDGQKFWRVLSAIIGLTEHSALFIILQWVH